MPSPRRKQLMVKIVTGLLVIVMVGGILFSAFAWNL